jgi:hypothetical protein
MLDFGFCPAFAGHAHAWIGDVIAHAKAAKDGKRIWLFEMGYGVVGDELGAQAFSERPPYLGFDPVCVGV